MRVMHAQVTYNMTLLIIFYRAIRALESRRLFALMAQMGEHRFLPLVQIATTRTLEVSLIDIIWFRINIVISPPLGGIIWNPWKSGSVLVISSIFAFSRDGRVLQIDVRLRALPHRYIKITRLFVKYYCYVKLKLSSSLFHIKRRKKKRKEKDITQIIVVFIARKIANSVNALLHFLIKKELSYKIFCVQSRLELR